MSAAAVQRVIVRMLYDPALVELIYSGGLLPELSFAERELITQTPRGAWGTDPYRRSRTLQALIEEYPVSAAVAGLGRLDAFFSSPNFHRAIQSRQRLVWAFATWLEPLAGPVVVLERAVAEARRDRPRRLAGGMMVRAPGIRSVSVPVGALARFEAIRASLGRDPVATLTRAGPVPLGAFGPETEWVLTERQADGAISLGTCAEALGMLLAYAGAPRAQEDLLAEAGRLGADPGEEAEVVEGLIAEGLLLGG